jgi:conjugal transfer pilus assembly protein TrbC
LIDQASRAGATLVLRGLVNGSIRDTVTRMQALIGSRRVAVQIDPEAFDRYGITRTPTFVLTMVGAGTEACASRVCGSSQQFVKVAGDVTLDYAMRYLNRDPRASVRTKRQSPLSPRLTPKGSNRPQKTGCCRSGLAVERQLPPEPVIRRLCSRPAAVPRNLPYVGDRAGDASLPRRG